jgi:hypothetical protein
MPSSGVMYWFLLVCMLSCSCGLAAQDLQVLVLDALNGKSQPGVEVRAFCAGPPRNLALNSSITNNEGIAKISTNCNDKQKIEILVHSPNKKEQCGDDAVMTFKDVTAVGFLSKPDSAGGIWCPTKVSRTLKPVPGQAIVFVKKPTWWQSHVAG